LRQYAINHKVLWEVIDFIIWKNGLIGSTGRTG